MQSLGQTFNRDRHFIDVSFLWMASVNLCSIYARLKTLKPFQAGWLVGEVRGARSQKIFSFLRLTASSFFRDILKLYSGNNNFDKFNKNLHEDIHLLYQ